ncbi:hypothetical protein BGW39_006582 [Mortierella sp. 14UC]|nr:hypothetical protein BGW39_006582 [Mortierella sp. 14UC]
MYPVLKEILEKFLPMFEEVLSEIQHFWTRPRRLRINDNDWYGSDPEFAEDHESDSDDGDDDDEEESEEDGGETPSKASKGVQRAQGAQGTKEGIHLLLRLPREPSPAPSPPPRLHPSRRFPAIQSQSPYNPSKSSSNSPTSNSHPQTHVTAAAPGMSRAWPMKTLSPQESTTTTPTTSRTRVLISVSRSRNQNIINLTIEGQHLYGVKNMDPLVQYLDGILTRQDRYLVFPNLFQHQVKYFQLIDPIKLGSRKILAFFLVNPEEPILSTTFVPPQKKGMGQSPLCCRGEQ